MMATKLRVFALLALALLPSAWLAWSWRAMPQLGLYHDDAIYWVTAKSIASGDGYKIASLPAQPWQTKYPPFLPALLSLVWKLNPEFPSNLKLAMLLTWLTLPVYVFFVRKALHDFGISGWQLWTLTFAAALNPLACLLSTLMMSELLFASLWMMSMRLAERAGEDRRSKWIAAAAGLLAGLAYLTRSMALPLLLTAPLCFAMKRQFRRAALFAAAMFPAVAGWQWWVSHHISRATDLVTLYYTNYLGYQFYNVPLADIPRVFWYNLDSFLMAIGKLLLFDSAVFEWPPLERVVAVAAIAGAVRLVRRSGRVQLPLAALAMSGTLLIWHYQPDQRFVLPLFPIAAAGIWTEMTNLCIALRKSRAKPQLGDRVAAGIGAAAVAGFALLIATTYSMGHLFSLPALLRACSDDLEQRRPVYTWLATHAEPQANVYAYEDPLVYLYAGRRACGLPIPPKFYYHDASADIDRLVLALPQFARQQSLDYLLLTPGDFFRDGRQQRARLLLAAASHDSALAREFASRQVIVYRRTR